MIVDYRYNVTRDILRKVKAVGEMLGMAKEKEKIESGCDCMIDWPCLNYESPMASPVTSPRLSNSSDEVHVLTTPSVTERLEPNTTSTSDISRSASDVDLVSTFTIYRSFVEKSLKRRGMLVVLQRIARMLGPALYKARMALSIAHPKYSDVTKNGLILPQFRPRVNICNYFI